MLTRGFWDLGKIVLMYALHTHVFEWRQSTSMLNPTGLQGTFGNVDSAYDIGEGLRERRRWLKDGLDSFAECYGGSGTSAGVWTILQSRAPFPNLLAYLLSNKRRTADRRDPRPPYSSSSAI